MKKILLEQLYEKYNSKDFVHPDPLEFLYNYDEKKDIEIAALIASSLAYGRVVQILKSVSSILMKMGLSPYEYIINATTESLWVDYVGFKHRFTTDDELISILLGIKEVLQEYGSLENCFKQKLKETNDTIKAMTKLRYEILKNQNTPKNSLLPCPAKGSACKRFHLFLRWMVRKDKVDLGCWEEICPSNLIIPLDTHMHRICSEIGFTNRKQNDIKTAIEITNSFKKICPDDPVKYDFCITRLGIRSDTASEANKFLKTMKGI